MYHEFYGLKESPFALTPDPRYLFLSEPHKEALASAIYGVQERKGFVLILGEVGTGKTTLIRHLLGRFGPNIRTVFVFNPGVTFLELLQLILRDLELPCPGLRRVEMIETLNEYLLGEAAAGRFVVLIIDEAQHLSPAVLEEVRMLSNLETTRGKLIQTILVGQPELGEKLGRPELRQLRQRIGLVAELKPLSLADAVQYIDHRLQVSGHSGAPVFSRWALKLIHRASGGIPRLINVICDKALVLGYAAGARPIRRRLIREVLKDWASFRRRRLPRARTSSAPRPGGRPRIKRGGRAGRIAAAGAVMVAGGLLALVLMGQRDEGVVRSIGGLGAAGASAPSSGVAAPAPVAPAPRVVREPGGSRPAPGPPASPATGRESVAARPPAPAPEPVAAGPAAPAVAAAPQPPPAALGGAPAREMGGELPPGAPPRPEGGAWPSLPEPAGGRLGAARVRGAAAPAERPAEVVVRPGDILTRLVAEKYGTADLTVLDFVKAANPEVANIDLLLVGQRLRFPPFEPRTLVYRVDDSVYRLHLLTVWDTQNATFRRARAAVERAGRQVYVIPVHLSRSETAYRVMVGPFADRREAEGFYQSMAGILGS